MASEGSWVGTNVSKLSGRESGSVPWSLVALEGEVSEPSGPLLGCTPFVFLEETGSTGMLYHLKSWLRKKVDTVALATYKGDFFTGSVFQSLLLP